MTSFWHSNLVPGTTPGNKPTTSVSEIATNKYWDKNILWIKTSQNKLLNLHSEIFQHSKIGLFCLCFFCGGFGFASKIPFGNFGILAEAKNIFDAKNAMHNSAQSCALRRAEALHLGYAELVPMLMFQLSCSFSSKFSFLVSICFVWLVVSLLIGFVN